MRLQGVGVNQILESEACWVSISGKQAASSQRAKGLQIKEASPAGAAATAAALVEVKISRPP